jgi:uncharacterized protein (TIGR00369 family)
MDWVKSWVETSPYGASLGVKVGSLSEREARLQLPFKEQNANPGKALHGGCAASLAVVGAGALARAALGQESGPWHTCAFQVNYLSAAIGEDVNADVRLLRRGKELCFVEVDVATADGEGENGPRSIAHVTAAVRARHGLADAPLHSSAGDDGASDPGPMGPHIEKLPFIAGRGIHIELMAHGRSRLRMPFRGENADGGGHVHDGAVLALLDTAGAMASWAETGPGRFKASTPAIQAQVLAPAPKSDLVAYGRVAQRDHEVFWSDVEVADASNGQVCARGTVLYRIVT